MAYALGAVKPHVRAAAESIGPRFSIRVIYGWRVGTKGEHPKGLALDFMTTQKAVGDALAAHVVANASSLNVTYVIWWYRIWTPGQGWHKYTGTPNPHVDHVHVSFGEGAGSGVVTDKLGSPVPGADEWGKINLALEYLSTAGAWKRIGILVGGSALVIVGVIRLGVKR
jgi:hypothetical protein